VARACAHAGSAARTLLRRAARRARTGLAGTCRGEEESEEDESSTATDSDSEAPESSEKASESTDESAGVEVHGGSDGAATAWADRSLREAYDAYVLKTYVAHSLTITTALNAAGVEKKKPDFGNVHWARDASTFTEGCNSLSIDCGRSKLIVVDVDFPALAAWKKIERRAGGPFDTFTVRSGSGGLHLYFEAFDDDQLNRSVSKCFSLDGAKLDIDLRGRGGCSFAPPSSYTNLAGENRSYVVIKDLDAMHMPARLVSALKSMLQPAGRGVHGRKRAGGAAPEAPAPRTTGACLGPWDVAGESWSGSQGSAAARCGFLWKTKGPKKTCGKQPRAAPHSAGTAPSSPEWPLPAPSGSGPQGSAAARCGFLWKTKGPKETCGKVLT
jgi:hypothetical protein